MAIQQNAVIQDQRQLDDLKLRLINRLRSAKQFWKPLNSRQDYWANLYLLQDALQQSKPLGVARRFVSNEPRTGLDSALSILTRNPVVWRIPFENSEDENSDERRTIGRIERTLDGFGYDLDELFSMRMQLPMWTQIHFQSLLRGMIWGKFHVTTEALKYRRSPLIAEIYDSRLVYPHVDGWGLNHVLIEKPTNLGDLVATYPEIYSDLENSADFNPHTPAVKIEFWSNDRGEKLGINAVLAQVGTANTSGAYTVNSVGGDGSADSRWLIPPYFHGYTYDELPIVGVPVNGAHIQHKPTLLGPLEQRLQERSDLLAMDSSNWNGPASWVAEIGRSILSSVEEQVPQYNELMATIFQHLAIETYGTLVFKTPTGELPKFDLGIESKIALTPQESVERLVPVPISPDAYRLVQVLQEERQKGVLSNILQASTPFSGTGVLFQQVTNAALNSLAPYQNGAQQFGIRMGTSILAQLQKGSSAFEPFVIEATAPTKSFFRIEFDPKTDLDQTRHYRPIPIIKPALPDDLTARMTAARMALDPRRPMLSLMTVMETILQVDDPTAELDRIWEDLAQTDPVIVAEQMALALDKFGETEMAARMRETEFRTKFIEDLQFRQITGNLPGQGQQPGSSPEDGVNPAATQRTGEPNLQVEGAQGLGAIGETLTP